MATTPVLRSVMLPAGEAIPPLGQGTWHFAEDPDRRDAEMGALRLGLELGLTLIDTAELYGGGAAEELVGAAIEGRRDEVFLVSKVLPSHATRDGTIRACEASLTRLGTEWIDLYLLHWRGSVPLEETIQGFESLLGAGLIRSWGVSNFDTSDMEELISVSGGAAVQTDQVLYNVKRRGIEHELLPWCRERGIPIMAYSPMEQGALLTNRALRAVAERNNASPAQIALAWVLRQPGVNAVARAGTPEHVRENRDALDIRLTREDLADLDHAFPPPRTGVPLEML